MAVMALDITDLFVDESPARVSETDFFEAEREQDLRALAQTAADERHAEQMREDADWHRDMMAATAEWNWR